MLERWRGLTDEHGVDCWAGQPGRGHVAWGSHFGLVFGSPQGSHFGTHFGSLWGVILGLILGCRGDRIGADLGGR